MSNRTLQELLPRVGTASDYINAHFLAATQIPSLQHRWLLTETWVLKIKEHFNFSSSVKLDKGTLNSAIARCNALGVLEIYDVAFNKTGIVKAVFSGRIGGDKSKKHTAYYSYAQPSDMPERPDMKSGAWVETVETGRTLREREAHAKRSLELPGIDKYFEPIPKQKKAIQDNPRGLEPTDEGGESCR